ncbi:MAG: DUF4145 domain-containing protein [Desulfomonilaceae bacterium]
MICPHCTIGVRLPISGSSAVYHVEHGLHKQWGYDVAHGFCPECGQLIVLIRHGTYWVHEDAGETFLELYPKQEEVIYPRRRTKPLSSDVPARYRNDFNEAFACLDVSPKASAAVSRRVLQDVLKNHYGISAGSLASQIGAFIARPDVPSYLAEQVDAVRNIGNFAAHPLKSTRTGEVLDVEPGEAEWLIGTLEALFDFTFVQPERLKRQRAQLNEKLCEAGKPPLK